MWPRPLARNAAIRLGRSRSVVHDAGLCNPNKLPTTISRVDYVRSAPRAIFPWARDLFQSELENFSVPPVCSPAESRQEETKPPVRAPAALKILSLSCETIGIF